MQNNIHELLGLKAPNGTIDKLVSELKKVYEEEITNMKRITKSEGNDLEQGIMDFMLNVLVGTGMKVSLAVMCITRIWTRASTETYATTVRDVVQIMCRMKVSAWNNYKEKCTTGGDHEDYLTDTSVEQMEGFKALDPANKQYEIGGMNFEERWLN